MTPPRKRTSKPIDFDKIAEDTKMPRGWADRNRRGAAVDETPAEVVETETVADVAPVETESTEGEGTVSIDTVEAPQAEQADAQVAEATSEQTSERKRGPRPAINVGNVVVRPSSRTDFTTRATPTETNPVFRAVKDAPLNTPTDILVENDDKKVQGAISILRRAGAKLNVGMHIAPKGVDGYPTEEVEGTTYAVLTFKTDSERRVRGRKAAEADTASESLTY